MDEVHVRRTRPHVFCCDVTSAKAFDKASVRPENRLTVARAIVTDDHGLSAAKVETSDSVLIGHAAGKPQRVDDSRFVGIVLPEACASERRSKCGTVHSDDAAVTARR